MSFSHITICTKEELCLDIEILFCLLSAWITEEKQCSILECHTSAVEVTCITWWGVQGDTSSYKPLHSVSWSSVVCVACSFTKQEVEVNSIVTGLSLINWETLSKFFVNWGTHRTFLSTNDLVGVKIEKVPVWEVHKPEPLPMKTLSDPG
jgi:hypothetical protein